MVFSPLRGFIYKFYNERNEAMKHISISEGKVSEALGQIEALEGLNPKNRGCLRLLTEEMFSMCKELLEVEQLDFDVNKDGETYTLKTATKTRVKEKTREQLLSVSSSGKNAANKGLKGLLGAALDALSYEGDSGAYSSMVGYGMHHMAGSEYAMTWTLSHYMESAPKSEVSKEWDGMEKSIIANFADDVAIGVRSGRVEMIVTKKF